MSGRSTADLFHLVDDLVNWEERYPLCGMAIALTGVVFLRSFGPWEKGERVDRLVVDLSSARLKSEKKVGEEIQTKTSAIRLTQVKIVTGEDNGDA